MLFLAVPISANSGPDRDTVHKLIDDSMDWLLHTHSYSDGSLHYGILRTYGTSETLKNYLDPDEQFVLYYELPSYNSVVQYALIYQKTTYHDWHSYKDMYAEAAKIFCGEWIERSVHSISHPSIFCPQDYKHFIEDQGDLYVCVGYSRETSVGELTNVKDLDDGWMFLRVGGEMYDFFGHRAYPFFNGYLYPIDKMEKYGAVASVKGAFANVENVYDDYIFKIVSADNNKAEVEVVVFDVLPIRPCAYKASLELENTEKGWRISGGSLIEAFYEDKELDKIDEDEFVAFLAEVGIKEVNPPLQSPETGDDTGVRVVFLATAAVVCAIIPATVAATTKRRRRED